MCFVDKEVVWANDIWQPCKVITVLIRFFFLRNIFYVFSDVDMTCNTKGRP